MTTVHDLFSNQLFANIINITHINDITGSDNLKLIYDNFFMQHSSGILLQTRYKT